MCQAALCHGSRSPSLALPNVTVVLGQTASSSVVREPQLEERRLSLAKTRSESLRRHMLLDRCRRSLLGWTMGARAIAAEPGMKGLSSSADPSRKRGRTFQSLVVLAQTFIKRRQP